MSSAAPRPSQLEGALLAALGLLLCASPVTLCAIAEPSPLSLGILVTPDQPDCLSLRQGAQLSARQSGTRLIVRGQPGQWGTDGNEAAVLALDDEVAALITSSDGSAAHQALQIAGRTRLPVVSLCPDSSITRAGVPWAVRIVPRTDEEALVIFKALPKRWAALVPAGRPGREIARDLKTAARLADCILAEPIPLNRAHPDAPQTVQALLSTSPDGVLLWTDPKTAARYAQLLRQATFPGALAGPAALRGTSFPAAAHEAAAGFFLVGLAAHPNGEALRQGFERQYRTEYGTDPNWTATMAHDAVLLLAQLLRGSAPGEGHRSFPVQEVVVGASGPLAFDRFGNRRIVLELLVYQAGQYRPFLAPTTAAVCSSYEPY